MNSKQPLPATVDEYIAAFPEAIQEKLQNIRQTVREAAPDAKEAIKYAMPTFTLYTNLVSFGVYKHHIGFYPRTDSMEDFKAELAPYESAKSSVRFPLNQPIPYDLITKMVKVRVADDIANNAQAKDKKTTKPPL